MVNLLFPGRHHLLTKFQKDYILKILKKEKVEKIIFAVTSSDHANTRRNPIPLYLRTLAIEKFSEEIPCEVKIYPIPDVQQTPKFGEYILHQIEINNGEKLTSKNTKLMCSTPPIIKMFKKLKFKNFPVELKNEKKNQYQTLRPYEIIEELVKSKDWKKYASEETQEVYEQYNLINHIKELFNDAVLNEDANLTTTRDYNSYARGMDQNIEFKFNDIKPFIVPGKIVDAGCGTGGLIWHLSKNFEESDIIGIEATRNFYEYCKLQTYPNPFVFFYRKNILDQNFKENTVNTIIYSSVLHEIYSYISKKALKKVIKNTYNQLAPGGRMIIRDVVGPESKKEKVILELNENDGKSKGPIKELSTYAKFFQFTKDFIPRKIKYKLEKINGKNLIELTIQDAYEFISKMNYTDNWKSEMHEEFGFWSFKDWKKELESEGFKIVAGSHAFKSEYIIEKMYKGKATIYKLKNNKLIQQKYPPTNMILVGEKNK